MTAPNTTSEPYMTRQPTILREPDMTRNPITPSEPSQSRQPHSRCVLLALLLAACGPAGSTADASAPDANELLDAGTEQLVDALIDDADNRPTLATDAEYLEQQPDANVEAM